MSRSDLSRRTALKGMAGGAALAAGAGLLGTPGQASAAPAAPAAAGPAPRDPAAWNRARALVAKMTTAEKLAQLQVLYLPSDQIPAAAKRGVGGIFWPRDKGVSAVNAAQKIAVEQTRLGIPLLVEFDVIHGWHTTFPIPLAQGASFDPTTVDTEARTAATEARSNGVQVTFAPMIDVSHEPRWGRVAEGNGEDPYLTSKMGAAKVNGLQQGDYSKPGTLAATAKHFIAYGQPEGGRDYNTVDLSEQRLRNFYLPPFAAAVQAGVASVMASFNTVSGVPGHANTHTLTDILRNELGFDGFVVSDANGVTELINHGVAANPVDAARIAINAGVDVPIDDSFATNLPTSVRNGAVSAGRLDQAVTRLLYIKVKLGLFENPYVDETKAITAPTAATRQAARTAAARSIVLLKNDRRTLPLRKNVASIAVIGPFADSNDLRGTWSGPTSAQFPSTTIAAGIRAAAPKATVTVAAGTTPAGDNTDGVAAAVAAAENAEAIVVVVGEAPAISGEASSRSDITLPGDQEALIQAVAALGKPFVVVVVNGRALALENVADLAPAWVVAWHGGIEAGSAVADVLFGTVNPGGKLPATFPRTVGQVPLYYNHENTGRPYNPDDKFTSKYIDELPTPLFPFGHGLSYTTFTIDQIQLDRASIRASALLSGSSVTVTARVTNTGKLAGDEVVQLYIRDEVATIAQPVRRLRGFQRVTLAAGASQTVTFTLGAQDLGFYTNNYSAQLLVEPGVIDVFVGNTSANDNGTRLTLT